MVEYNKIKIKLPDWQLNKLNPAVTNYAKVTLRISMEMFEGNSLSHELLLTTGQKTKPRNVFENSILTDTKFSKTQISNIIQYGGFLGSLLSKIVAPLTKAAVPLAKRSQALLWLTAAASAINEEIQRKIHASRTTAVIIPNEQMNDTMKIVQVLKNSNILLKWISKTIENETKGQKRGFLRIFLRNFRS